MCKTLFFVFVFTQNFSQWEFSALFSRWPQFHNWSPWTMFYGTCLSLKQIHNIPGCRTQVEVASPLNHGQQCGGSLKVVSGSNSASIWKSSSYSYHVAEDCQEVQVMSSIRPQSFQEIPKEWAAKGNDGGSYPLGGLTTSLCQHTFVTLPIILSLETPSLNFNNKMFNMCKRLTK